RDLGDSGRDCRMASQRGTQVAAPTPRSRRAFVSCAEVIMSDDIDELLRTAMKSLDEQVPSGYFDTLPNQTLARREGSRHHGAGPRERRGGRRRPPVPGEPPRAQPPKQEEREEASGLHDIRTRGASAKMRISNKPISTAPPIEDDAIASTSGSFKN